MKNKFLLFCLALSMSVMAGERSAMDAAALAAEFMNQTVNAPARKASVGATSMKLSHTRMKLNSAEPAFYVFNQTSNNGYVVVSADDRTEDVLMYSDNGTLDVENANPNLKFWLNRLQEEISAANDENTYTPAEKKARKATTVTAISPLLGNIAWDQDAPYYNQCPYSYYDSEYRCLTGCVATAAAQIMRKWKYPEKATGSKTYTWYDFKDDNYVTYKTKQVTKDFSTVTFDWANMLETYGKSYTDAQATAVATLMYCCGVACEMDYGSANTCGGSGSWTDEMAYGLKTYFGYNIGKMISNYNSQEEYESDKGESMKNIPALWKIEPSEFGSYFDEDLEAGRPILMGGYSKSSGGHEFVCDGRDASGQYHINWGWSGESNNYCAITALKPSGTKLNFSSSVDALIGLQPAAIDTVHVTGVTVAPTTLTLKQKEKSTLTATVAPTNATDKTVTWSSSDSKIATVSTSGQVTGVAEGKVTITATTKDGGKKATCAVTVTEEIVESKEFTLVTNAKSLTAGMEVLIVNVANKKALSTNQKSNNRDAADVTITNNAIELADDQTTVQVLKLLAGTTSGTWAFSPSDGEYLYAASSSKNYLRTQKSLDANASFTVTISSNEATITAQGTNTRNVIRYNKGDDTGSWFACYSATSTDSKLCNVAIFARETSEPTKMVETIAPVEKKATKVLLDGQLYLLYNNQLYNLQGQVVK